MTAGTPPAGGSVAGPEPAGAGHERAGAGHERAVAGGLRPAPRRARKVMTADVRGPGLNARIARTVTAAVGTMYAFYALALFMAGWILWQTALTAKPFDPYPFAFLLFLGNIVQLLLMPLIMVGQNVQSAHADARAEADFEVNTKAEEEVEKLLRGLREIDERTLEIVRRLEALELSAHPGGGTGGPPGR